MPWIDPDPSFGRIGLAQVDDDAFRLLHPLAYVDPDGTPYVVPAGQRTDLASVPFVFWGQIGPFGRQTRAAVVHDHGTAVVGREHSRRSMAAVRARAAVDQRFLHGLVDDGVPRLRAHLMWAAVSVHRVVVHAPAVLAAAAVVQLAVAVALLYRAVLVGDAAGLAGAIAVLLLSLVWGRAAGAMVLLQLVGAVALPLAVANLLLATGLWLVNLVVTAGHERDRLRPSTVLTRSLGLRL